MAISHQIFMQTWYDELWNKGNEDIIDELMHPHGKAFGLSDGPITGIDSFKQFYRAFKAGFSDIKVTVNKNLISDDHITSYCTVTGFHKETKQHVEFSGITIGEIKDGKLLNAWNQWDFLGMYQQIGKITAEQLA